MPGVSSSAISSIEYDEESQTLTVYFIKGGVYEYGGVPKDVYEAFLNSGSPGRFFLYNIRGIYG
jgi:hypothetical protein